jgi:hypothetical protein
MSGWSRAAASLAERLDAMVPAMASAVQVTMDGFMGLRTIDGLAE